MKAELLRLGGIEEQLEAVRLERDDELIEERQRVRELGEQLQTYEQALLTIAGRGDVRLTELGMEKRARAALDAAQNPARELES